MRNQGFPMGSSSLPVRHAPFSSEISSLTGVSADLAGPNLAGRHEDEKPRALLRRRCRLVPTAARAFVVHRTDLDVLVLAAVGKAFEPSHRLVHRGHFQDRIAR